MLDYVFEEAAYINRCATKLAKVRRQRRPAQAAGLRDARGQLNCVQAAARQDFVRVLRQPRTVMSVQNIVGGERDPLSRVRWRRPLTIPGLRLRHEDVG